MNQTMKVYSTIIIASLLVFLFALTSPFQKPITSTAIAHQSADNTQSGTTVKTKEPKDVFKVISIVDGRTINVRNASKSLTVTLNGIQVPTDDTKYQKAVEKKMKKDLTGKNVTLKKTKGTNYDVILGNQLEQYSLISDGLGVVDNETINNDHYSDELINAQQHAKASKIGVWEIDGYVDDGYFNPEVIE